MRGFPFYLDLNQSHIYNLDVILISMVATCTLFSLQGNSWTHSLANLHICNESHQGPPGLQLWKPLNHTYRMPVIYRLHISETSVRGVNAAPWWIVCLSPPDITLYIFHFTAGDCYNDVGCRLYTLPKTCEQSSVRLYNFLQGTTVTYHSLERKKVVFPISPATFSDLLLIALTISNETPINFHFGANFQTALHVFHMHDQTMR